MENKWKQNWIKPGVALASIGKAAATAGLSINEMAKRHFGTPGRMGQMARVVGAMNGVSSAMPKTPTERIKNRYDKGTN